MGLEQVTVTAQKRAQPLQDVPLSIQAFTGAQLQREGVAELGELIRFIPGASQGISNSYGFQTYQIRSTGTVTGDSTVAYYLDEAAFSLLNSNIAPVARTFDVDRVEVLRGPQGTLYGLSALGGAIRFITADPDLQSFRARGQVGVSHTSGGNAGYFGDVALSVPLIEGKLAGRIAIDYEKKGGFVEVSDFPGQKNLDPTTIQNYRAKLRWQPADNLVAKLTVQHNEVQQDVGTLLVSADPPVATQGTNAGLGGIRSKYDMVAAFVSADLGAGKLESSTGWLKYNLTQTAFINIGGPVTAVQGGNQPTFSEELRYVSNPGSGPVDWVVGGFYKHAKSDSTINLSGAFALDLATTTKDDNYAVFGEASTNLFNGQLVPLVGARYSWDKRSTNANGTDQSADFNAFTPRFNLAWLPSRDATYFINIARGARSGQFNNPALVPIAQGLGVPAQASVPTDSIWSFEVGTKGNLLGGRLGYDLSAYHTNWKDVQLTAAPAAGLGVVVNGGRAKGDGIDYGLVYLITRSISISLTGNLNNTRLRDMPDYVANSSPTDGLYNGARMPYSPHDTETIGINAEQPIGDGWKLLGTASYSHASGTNQANSGLTSDSVNIVNARIGTRKDKFTVLLYSDNIGNRSPRTYREFGLVNRPYPRTVGLQVNYEY